MSLYYTWIRQYESLKLAQNALNERKKVQNSIENRQKKKIADQTDVNKIRLQTITSEEQALEFESAYKETTNSIKRALGVSENQLIKPDTTITLSPTPPSINTQITQLIKNSRSIKLLNTLTNTSHLQVKRNQRETLPAIALTAAAITQDQDNRTQIGTQISLPFIDKTRRARVEFQKLTAAATKLESDTSQNNLIATLKSLNTAIHIQRQLITLATEKQKLAEAILKDETQNYAFGKITLNDYIDAITRKDSTRFEEIDKIITYQQLIIRQKQLTDTLVTQLPKKQ